MATPKAGYKLKDGTKVSGVTTILGRFKESGGLIRWAFEQGKLAERGIIKDLYDKAEEAADIGTQAHERFELYLRGQELPPCENPKVIEAFNNAVNWLNQSRIRIIPEYQEITMVSEKHKFGGTPDAIGELDGKLILLDWKTSNAVYQDYLIQVAAYKQLWEENHPDKPITGGYYICRFSKDFPDFAAHYFGELDEAWEMFLMLRRAFDIDKVLKKRAA